MQAEAATDPSGAHPKLQWIRDGILLGGGSAASLLSQAIHVDRRPVPAQGLDRSKIHLGIDRHVIGENSVSAGHASDIVVTALGAYPFLLSSASASSRDHLRAPLRILVPYMEASLLTTGITEIVKRGVSRPRPYTYLPQAVAPGTSAVLDVNAYLSFPSGHSSMAWCATTFATVDHVLSRPHASWKEQAAIGYFGGVAATTTGVLRIRAGQHFPTDVAGGAVVGALCGAGVPLLHAYVFSGTGSASPGTARAPKPSGKAWLNASAGTAAGVVTVLALAALF